MYDLLNQTLKNKYQLWFDKPILLTKGRETTHWKPWFSRLSWQLWLLKEVFLTMPLHAEDAAWFVSCRGHHWLWHLESVAVFLLMIVSKSRSGWGWMREGKERWGRRGTRWQHRSWVNKQDVERLATPASQCWLTKTQSKIARCCMCFLVRGI